MGTQTTVPCAQEEDSGLLGQLQPPNWVKVCLVSTVFFLPVSTEPGVEKCLGGKERVKDDKKSLDHGYVWVRRFFFSLIPSLIVCWMFEHDCILTSRRTHIVACVNCSDVFFVLDVLT